MTAFGADPNPYGNTYVQLTFRFDLTVSDPGIGLQHRDADRVSIGTWSDVGQQEMLCLGAADGDKVRMTACEADLSPDGDTYVRLTFRFDLAVSDPRIGLQHREGNCISIGTWSDVGQQEMLCFGAVDASKDYDLIFAGRKGDKIGNHVILEIRHPRPSATHSRLPQLEPIGFYMSS